MPQTINGTITGISTEASFTTYTVTLAAYDLIPTLAVQQGQTTVLTEPSTVVIYVDKATQMLNQQPLVAGSVMRCNGMLFNDNGTMRMDCGQVNDGVAMQPVQNAATARSSSSGEQRLGSPRILNLNHVSQPVVVLHQRFRSKDLLPTQKMP
jgi:hypothetical protein